MELKVRRTPTVSNRLPIEISADGQRNPSPGGLASALSSVTAAGTQWVGWAGPDAVRPKPFDHSKPSAGGNGCQAFEVGCKVEQPIGPSEVGVTARVMAAMSWNAWNTARGDFDPASGSAVFTKTNGKWARRDLSTPVNLTTCATF